MSLVDFLMIEKYLKHGGKRENILEGYHICQNIGDKELSYADEDCRITIKPDDYFAVPNRYYKEWSLRSDILDLPIVFVRKARFV